MPETRSRSRTPSRAAASSPKKTSPKAGDKKCCFNLFNCCSNMSPYRREICGMICGSAFALLVVVGSACTIYHRIDRKFTSGALAERLAFTLRCLFLAGIPLAASIKHVCFVRLRTGAMNPMLSDRQVDMANKILRNTLENYILHCATMLAVTTYLGPEHMKFIVLFTFIFIVGRILFFLGYPNRRVFGFALSHYPSALAAMGTMYYMYRRGLNAF